MKILDIIELCSTKFSELSEEQLLLIADLVDINTDLEYVILPVHLVKKLKKIDLNYKKSARIKKELAFELKRELKRRRL